jgi:hypothetical protein
LGLEAAGFYEGVKDFVGKDGVFIVCVFGVDVHTIFPWSCVCVVLMPGQMSCEYWLLLFIVSCL